MCSDMPLPLLAPAAAAAAKHAAAHAVSLVSSVDVGAVSSASLAAVLARLAWNRVPDWVKEDVSFRKLDGNVQEMERLSSVIEKLQALATTGSSKLASPVPHLQAAILAYVQLSAQLKLVAPDARDVLYHSSGRPCAKQDLEGLKDALDYATWAYYVDDKERLQAYLEEVDFFLLRNHLPTRPGYVGHYAALSPEKKVLLIGIKGTSSLEDLLTDCCGRAVPYDSGVGDDVARVEVRAAVPEQVSALEESVEVASGHERIWVEEGDKDHHIRCHEGILVATKRLADEVQSTVEDLVVGGGYKLVLVGHSLGAGAASLLAFILRSRIPKLADESIQVYAFAPPPVLDHDAAVAAAPFVTSIVNNSDIIPRSSLVNLMVFLEFLRAVSQRLKEKGLNPTGPRSTTAFLSKLAQGTKGDLLMSFEEVRDAMDAAHDKVELRHPVSGTL